MGLVMGVVLFFVWCVFGGGFGFLWGCCLWGCGCVMVVVGACLACVSCFVFWGCVVGYWCLYDGWGVCDGLGSVDCEFGLCLMICLMGFFC